jgi:predicted MFS family arabinose efflux permease
VALVLAGHAAWMAWLAAAPLLAVPLVGRLVRAVDPPPPPQGGGDTRRAVAASVAPSLVLLAVTLAGGGVLTFLPIERPDGALATAALLAFGVAAALARWRAGLLADRLGARALLPASLAVGVAGLAVLAGGLGVDGAGGAALVLAGVLLVGTCYGAVQNLTLVVAFARAGAGGTTAASAVWNACFDAGTGLGAAALGVAVAGAGLATTLLAVAVLVVATVPVALASTPR